MMRKFFLILICLFCCACVFAEKRVALVIGNGKYKNSPLKNPVGDASEVSKKLRSLNFSVTLETDADTETMDTALKSFYKNIENADVAFFYFSGHGIQNGNVNYLLPLDEKIKSEDDLERHAVNLNKMISKSQNSGCSKLIVILDACRNNPLGKSRGASKGLVLVSESSPTDTCIAFSCGSGKTADDGDGPHSPYTEALLNHIADPDTIFDVVLQRVSKEVMTKTNGNQKPNYHSDFCTQLCLNGTAKNTEYIDHGDFVNSSSRKPVLPFLLGMIFATVFASLIFFFAFTVAGKKIVSNVGHVFAFRNERKSVKSNDANFTGDSKSGHNAVSMSMDAVAVKNLFVATKPVTKGLYKSIFGGDFNSGEEDYPLTNVSWEDALVFLNKLSEKDGLEPVYDITDFSSVKCDLTKNGWRLPTEQEWKKIAREQSINMSELDSYAWTSENSDGKNHAAGCKRSGRDGIHDIFGLVWEWCFDGTKENFRIAKGGSWDAGKDFCSISESQKFLPSFKSDALGFRGVRKV